MGHETRWWSLLVNPPSIPSFVIAAFLMIDPSHFHDEGAKELARISMRHALMVCSSKESLEAKKRSLYALLVIPWTASLATFIGGPQFVKLKKLCSNSNELLEISIILKNRIVDLHRGDILNLRMFGDEYRCSMLAWRCVLLDGKLWTKASPVEWSSVLTALHGNAIRSPSELSNVPLQDLSRLGSGDTDMNLLRSLWQAAVLTQPQSPFDRALADSKPPEERTSVRVLAHSISGRCLADTKLARDHQSLLEQMEAKAPGFSRAGPAQRINLCASAQVTPDELACFQRSAVALNTAKKVACSLPGVASAMKAWGKFCDLNRIPHFPVDRERVLEFSAYLNDSNSFAVYIAHLKTACYLQQVPVDWDTPGLRAVTTGLKRAGEQQRALKSAITQDMLEQIINLYGLEAEFSLFAFICWIFLLRAFSECLPLRMCCPEDDLREGSPLPVNRDAVIGLRDDEVRIQLAKRKNLRSGSVISRACTCETKGQSSADEEQQVPRILCPVHHLWKAVEAKYAPGDKLFPSLTLNAINPLLKELAKRFGWPDPLSYGSHAFRRGGAQALARANATFAEILNAGQWRTACATKYLNLGELESRTAALLAIKDDLSDSSDDEPLAWKHNCEGPPRKRQC